LDSLFDGGELDDDASGPVGHAEGSRRPRPRSFANLLDVTTEDDPRKLLPGTLSRRCPFCGDDADARLRHALWTGRRLAYVGPMGPIHNKLATGLYQCERCHGALMLLYEDASEPELVGAWPRMRAHSNEALPPDVDADRVEAWNCFFGAEHRAAVVMARSALGRALRSLVPGRETTADGLDALTLDGRITPETRRNVEEAGLVEPSDPIVVGEADAQAAEKAVHALDEFLAETIAPAVR
jgi:hypothetical protein